MASRCTLSSARLDHNEIPQAEALSALESFAGAEGASKANRPSARRGAGNRPTELPLRCRWTSLLLADARHVMPAHML
jgi:hypothetical protein